MSEEEKIKKEWKFISQIVDAINENLHKWGFFELWLRDYSFIDGSEFSIAYYGNTYYIIIHEGEKIIARISIKLLKFITPELFVVEQIESDKNE